MRAIDDLADHRHRGDTNEDQIQQVLRNIGRSFDDQSQHVDVNRVYEVRIKGQGPNGEGAAG